MARPTCYKEFGYWLLDCGSTIVVFLCSWTHPQLPSSCSWDLIASVSNCIRNPCSLSRLTCRGLRLRLRIPKRIGLLPDLFCSEKGEKTGGRLWLNPSSSAKLQAELPATASTYAPPRLLHLVFSAQILDLGAPEVPYPEFPTRSCSGNPYLYSMSSTALNWAHNAVGLIDKVCQIFIFVVGHARTKIFSVRANR
jgi:hypothetical protein